MNSYLTLAKVPLKAFGEHLQEVTGRIRQASEALFVAAGRPVIYLPSSQESKEQIARQIAQRDGIREGPICLLRCVEPCCSFEIYRDRQAKQLRLVSRYRKCLHLYHYFIHPIFGFMSARIQTWFPLNLQVCLNGREWLSRQMDQEGIAYRRAGNCFAWIEDFERAQALMQAQQTSDWEALLAQIVRQLNPLHEELFADLWGSTYYWSVRQSEWATDICLRDPSTLGRLYPKLVRHGLTALASGDVMRFLGHQVCKDGQVRPTFEGEVVTDVKRRVEGIRIKHSVHTNSVKAYDKAYTSEGAVLRIETTLNDAQRLKVQRQKSNDPQGPKQWLSLRDGLVDLPLRAMVCQRTNERYIEALASADTSATLAELTEPLTRPTLYHGRRVRALHLFGPHDLPLLAAVSRGEFAIGGLRNKDLQRLLFDAPALSKQEARRRSASITRKLRLLRAHGILEKLEHQHVYQLTSTGRTVVTAILTAYQAQISQLLPEAA
jgi:hypothetical protein